MTEPEVRTTSGEPGHPGQPIPGGLDGRLQDDRFSRSRAARAAARARREHGLKDPAFLPGSAASTRADLEAGDRIWAPSVSRISRVLAMVRRQVRQ